MRASATRWSAKASSCRYVPLRVSPFIPSLSYISYSNPNHFGAEVCIHVGILWTLIVHTCVKDAVNTPSGCCSSKQVENDEPGGRLPRTEGLYSKKYQSRAPGVIRENKGTVHALCRYGNMELLDLLKSDLHPELGFERPRRFAIAFERSSTQDRMIITRILFHPPGAFTGLMQNDRPGVFATYPGPFLFAVFFKF